MVDFISYALRARSIYLAGFASPDLTAYTDDIKQLVADMRDDDINTFRISLLLRDALRDAKREFRSCE